MRLKKGITNVFESGIGDFLAPLGFRTPTNKQHDSIYRNNLWRKNILINNALLFCCAAAYPRDCWGVLGPHLFVSTSFDENVELEHPLVDDFILDQECIDEDIDPQRYAEAVQNNPDVVISIVTFFLK
jgi:hypothetical protein